MTDNSLLLSNRVEDFRYELLDLQDNVVDELRSAELKAGSLDFSVYATIRGSGNLTVHASDIDWMKHRVRISYLLDNSGKLPAEDPDKWEEKGWTSFRFQPTKLRNDATANSVQFCEFQILVSGVRVTGGTAYGYSNNSQTGEEPNKANDNDIATKALDYNKTNGYWYIVFPEPVFAEGYKWATANDFPERDPISWDVYASNDTIPGAPGSWVLLDRVEDYATPTDRFTFLQERNLRLAQPGESTYSTTTVVPLITAIPRAPVEKHGYAGTSVDVELYDKTLILSDDRFGESYSLGAGTNIIEAVADVITSTGEPEPPLLTPSSKTLAAGMVWEAGTSKLKIVNDLLDAAGYFALYTDGHGRFHADPYTTPSSRPSQWNFANTTAIYLATWTRDQDVFAIPNKYICVGRTEGDTAALTSTATDEGDGPYSYESRGRWITRVDTNVEASNQTVLDMIAERRLYEAQQVTETFEFTHPWLPFGLNDVVEFNGTKAVVWKQSVKLQTGGLITSTARSLL